MQVENPTFLIVNLAHRKELTTTSAASYIKMPLCISCLGLQAASFPQAADPYMFKAGTKELSTTSTQLRSTRDQGCESCFMILDAVQHCGRDVSASCGEPWDINSPHTIQLRVLDRDIWTIEATWDVQNKRFHRRKPNIEVELYSESKESSLFKHLGTSKAIPPRLTPDECADTFDAWMSECRDHHECPKPKEAFLPKRVIDVRGFTQHESVTLLETISGQRGHYIALSHCWGSESFIQTTRATLRQRKTCIDWSDLPRTFQDTITFARRIKLQYIWIDSLCIIQDDRLDWETESAVMANIYSNAYITLAATGPAGNGCFFERWTNPSILNWVLKVPVHSHQLSSLRNPNLKLYARIRLDGTFNSFTAGVTIGILEDSAPLLSRAWVFQERFLSPRVLYFHPSSLVWECRSALYLEPYSLEDFSTQRTESDVPVRLKKLFAKLDSPSTTLVAEVHDLWLSFVDEYSRLRLTYETDRLPALSGVATRFQEFMSAKGFTDEYLAGIWRSDLVRSLAWGRSEGVTRRFPKPCPPSWSWASCWI